MSDLDKKLSKFFTDYGLGVGISEDDFVEQIKQAFIDAGWEQNSLAALKGVRVYQVTTAEPSDVDYSPAPESRYGELLMPGSEWYERFVGELGDYDFLDDDASKVIEAAKKAAGLDQ